MYNKDVSRYISPIFGSRIYSKDLEARLCAVLQMSQPKRPNFYFFVKTLKECNYPFNDLMKVVEKHNQWNNYNRSIFYEESRKVYKERKRNSINAGAFCAPSGTAPAYTFDYATDVDIINLFFDHCDPWIVNPPKSKKAAALYYYYEGAHVIPMGNIPKTPSVPWADYQERQPELREIFNWNWDYGVLLLGTKDHCFLDIDIYSPLHPKGLQNFNEKALDGWCYERTRNGGYHVFGHGNMPVVRGEGVEIKGKGGYVVTSPTNGYYFN